MRNLKREPLHRPNAVEWHSWAELVQRNLSELDRPKGAGILDDAEAQSWLLIERALKSSFKALEEIQPRVAMR
jgi:hypothetical protein